VPGDRVAKVLDVVGPLEAGSEEAAKGRNERGKDGEDEGMELEGRPGQGGDPSTGLCVRHMLDVSSQQEQRDARSG
jgi:hypothetical protein